MVCVTDRDGQGIVFNAHYLAYVDMCSFEAEKALFGSHAKFLAHGIDVVVAVAGNMRTGGPAKTASALARAAERMTPQERGLYGEAFRTFEARLNSMQDNGLASVDAARRVIEIAEQNPVPRFAAVGQDAEEILRVVREQSDDEQDALRLQIIGLR